MVHCFTTSLLSGILVLDSLGDFLSRFSTWMRSDLRVQVIFGAMILSALACVIAAWLVHDIFNVGRFRGAFYASLVAGVVLSFVITLVIAVASLSRPDKAVFEARARNFLRQQKGPHIDDLIGKMQQLFEPYCTQVSKTMRITRFDQQAGLLLVVERTQFRLKSYLDDIEADFDTSLKYSTDTEAPDSGPQASLTYLRVNGHTIAENRTFTTRLEQGFTVPISKEGEGEVEHRKVYWCKPDIEPHVFQPVRFCRKLVLTLANDLPSLGIEVELRGTAEIEEHSPPRQDIPLRISVAPGHEARVIEADELPSGTPAYNFILRVAAS